MAFLTNIIFFTYFNLTLLCLLIVFFFYYGNEKKLKLRRFASTFPGPKTIFYFGNALNFMLHPEDTSNMLYDYIKKYGSRFRLWIGEQLYIVLSDIEDIEEVLGGNKFINKGDDFYDIFGRIFGIATFSAAGMAWKRSRKILLPTFKANILRDYIAIMNSETNKMAESLKPLIKIDSTFNISEYLRILTFNVICKSLFDLEEDISKNEISIFFDKHGKHMTDCSNLMFQTKLFRKINQILSRKEFEEIENKMRLPYTKVLLENKLNQNPNSEIENDGKNRKFIEYLQDDTFSEQEKKEEIIGYTAAGTEPLSFTMSFTFLMLGIHEEIQEKAHRELVGIFGNSDRDATEEDLKRMLYLEQVINEVMRHFPIAPFLFRATSETIKLNDLTLPAGTSLLINILGLHKDSRYFPEPDSFNPEHFSKENFKKLRKGCFVPFGRGPRICIAKEFAIYQMKITLSAILRRYQIHTSAKKEDIMLSYAFISNNVNGFQISLSERK